MNPLPPQAYTKETLLKAYAWLQNQAPHIREMATTPDIMVSLFLKASRDGDSALDRPSIQNFKSELKSLAGLMGALDKPVIASPQTTVSAPPPLISTAATPSASPSAASVSSTPPPSTLASTSIPASAASDAKMEHSLGLDPRSLEMIRQTREQLNLSQDSEALRYLISVGYQKSLRFLQNS